jgi:glycosyltransferase involved in cell wall biosynthesis
MILLFQKIIPYYRLEIFRQLNRNLNIIVSHSKGLKGSTNKAYTQFVDFPNELIPSFYFQKKETSLIQNIFPVLRKHKPEIVITEFSFRYITFWLLYFLRYIYRFKLILWTHGISNNEINNPFKSFRGKVSLHIYRNADAIIVYSEKRASLIRKFLDVDKVFVAPNTIDLRKNIEVLNKLSISSKHELRKQMGFTETYQLVFSGRLIPNKRLDLLLEVYLQLKQKFDIGLHIIGDGPEIHIFRCIDTPKLGIYLHGEIYSEEEVGKIIYSSDLMLFTGAVGLAVLHSFSFGIPLVAFQPSNNIPPHGPEIEYLENTVNCILCPMDLMSMVREISKLLENRNLLESMQKNALDTAKKYSVDRMIDGFNAAMKYCKPSSEE